MSDLPFTVPFDELICVDRKNLAEHAATLESRVLAPFNLVSAAIYTSNVTVNEDGSALSSMAGIVTK
jgi:hypothetical protein